MSRQIGSLNRSLSYQSNLERHSSRISLSDQTSSALPTFSSNSARMGSDDSTQPILYTISQFNNSDVETPDEFHDSEPNPPPFSQTPFNLLFANSPMNPPQSPLHTLTPLQFLQFLVNEELEPELDNFITLQQTLQNPHTLRIHQLLHLISISES